jgi:hypothetical protein
MWISRIAFLVGVLIAGAVAFLLYFMVANFFTVFLLGLEGDTLYGIQYGICLVAGYATAIYLMRGGWPKAPAAKRAGG